MGACHRFEGGFAGAQPRLAKIAQYIAIFRLIAVAPYLSLRSVRRGRVPQPTVMLLLFPCFPGCGWDSASRDDVRESPTSFVKNL